MRKVLLLFALMPLILKAQIYEDFETGLLTNWVFNVPDRWCADQDLPLNGSYSLHHAFDNSDAGSDCAFYPVTGIRPDLEDVKWSFSLRHGYPPSSSNRWAIYLLSDAGPDELPPDGSVNGFALGVNLKGYDDTLRIWRVTDSSTDEIVTTLINWQNDIGTDSIVTFSVIRSVEGVWRLFITDDQGSELVVGEGECPDLYPPDYFGIVYNYTSSRDMLFWFDDLTIDGLFVFDTTPPGLKEVNFTGNHTLDVTFTEPVSGEALINSNFILEPGGIHPCSVSIINSERVVLYFAEPLPNKVNYFICVDRLCDISGNCADRCSDSVMLAYPEWGDILISEFMCDPEPEVFLPVSEYIELHNSTGFPFDLGTLSLIIGSDSTGLTGYTFEGSEYIVLCNEDDTALFRGICPVIPLSSFPSLNNGSDLIVIKDTNGGVIHGVDYSKSWFGDGLKSEGGWSMEIIDTDYPFSGRSNWSYSANRQGGTPGGSNSVAGFNPDITPPELINVFATDKNRLALTFSEPVMNLTGFPDKIITGGPGAREAVSTDPLKRRYRIDLFEEVKTGLSYTLIIDGDVIDCAGNKLKCSGFPFGVALKANANDIVFNEVLFDPLPWEHEYIEIFNRSEKIIDAGSLIMVSVNSEPADTGRIIFTSDEPRCIMPGDYYAVTKDCESVVYRYYSGDPEHIFGLSSLPSLPDDEGILILYYRDLEQIDRLHYSEDQHFDLLSYTAGISLERIDPDKKSGDISNWHSATGLSGWGTPGAKNSVFIEDENNPMDVVLSSKKITPDNDGFEDILTIDIVFESSDRVVTILIFNDHGFRVRNLAENITSGEKEKVLWDGTDDNGTTVIEGIYIIYIRSVGKNGDIDVWKKVCAVIR